MTKKNSVGRPTKMTKELIGKLEDAFSRGYTDTQACIHANIACSTLYDYCNLYPEFSERKEELKANPVLLAKNNIYDKIVEGDKDVSKWYLERKAKDEFSTRSEVTGKDGGAIESVSYTQEELIEWRDKLKGGNEE